MFMRHIRILLLVALGLSACRSTPGFRVESPAGVASAYDVRDAWALAVLGNYFAPKVCEVLGVEMAPPFVIEEVSGVDIAGVDVKRDSADRIVSQRIVLGGVAMRVQTNRLVVHELVHWYKSDPWDRLPHVVEEGLAEYICLIFAPEFRDPRVAELAEYRANLTPERRERALSVTWQNKGDIPKDERTEIYAVGYEIVERLGIEGVRALCVKAREQGLELVPMDWFEGG
jgi:hypothetical protein